MNTLKILKENKFETDKIDKDYLCIICKNILINAHSGPCGCNYCYECISKFLYGAEKCCPGNSNKCKKIMLNLNKNIYLKKSLNENISKLVVQCPIENCYFKEEISKMESHIKMCNIQRIYCPYHDIGCKQFNLIKNDITNHLLLEIVPHSHLLLGFMEDIKNDVELLKKNKEEFKDENKLLKKDIGDLKDENELLKIDIKKLKDENKSINQLITLKDEIEIVKLNGNGNQTDISEFERKEKKNKEEMIALNKEMKKIKKEILSMKTDLEKVKSEQTNKKMDNTIATVKTKAEQQKVEIDEIKNKLEIVENKQADCTVKSHEAFTDTSHLIKKVEEIDNIMKNTISKQLIDLQIQINKSREMYFGEFEWKIDNYSKLSIGQQINSKSFYSFKCGYHMCLSIDIVQDQTKCKYFNVYLHLVRGEFDNNLSWPCKCDVSIDLINHNDNRSYKNETIKYNSRSINPRWNKPEGEMNSGILFLAPSPLDVKSLLKYERLLIKCKTNIPL